LLAKILTPLIVKNFIPARKILSRKGDNGKVLVLGGNYLYHGAPIFHPLQHCELVPTWYTHVFQKLM